MKRTVLLLRHGKATPAEDAPVDRDRGLIARGVDDCATIGRFLQDRGLQPDVVLCSSARRTRDTLELVRASARWSKPPRTEVRDSLYLASVDELVSAVQELGPDVGSVLIVAHSPGIEETASLLAIDEDTPQLQALRDRFPTCGLAVLECDSDWADAGAGRLRLQRFVTPRELNDAA